MAFGRELETLGFEILSTGGSARALREAGVAVTDVATYTESPEVMHGRVKTLHPRVHGGILMRDLPEDERDLARLGGAAIDLVCVNLYPFEATVASGACLEEAVEQIDIGGPSMVRSAAKNHARVTVVTDVRDYGAVLEALRHDGEVSLEMRRMLALKAFRRTAVYDAAIADYLGTQFESAGQYPEVMSLRFEKKSDLRYGENPHQSGAVYVETTSEVGTLARAERRDDGNKELSFNNYVDVNAALEAVREFESPAAVVVKHTNPCGVAVSSTLEKAFRTAREADALSAFGGIVALNRRVDEATAKALVESFLECVVAPEFTEDALGVLREKKNLRLLATCTWLPGSRQALDLKRIEGGLVVQDRDASGMGESSRGKVVTRRAPTEQEKADLDFAWCVCKHVKSNAIVMAKSGATVGVGAGQMSRVVSVDLAAKKAEGKAKGAVLASDAFFPFADGLEAAAKAGVTAVVQPGGSKRDEEVIRAADEAGIAMVFTGARHFRH